MQHFQWKSLLKLSHQTATSVNFILLILEDPSVCYNSRVLSNTSHTSGGISFLR